VTKNQEDRLKDLVNIKDMMPNVAILRSDVAAAIKEIERLRLTETQYNRILDDLRKA